MKKLVRARPVWKESLLPLLIYGCREEGTENREGKDDITERVVSLDEIEMVTRGIEVGFVNGQVSKPGLVFVKFADTWAQLLSWYVGKIRAYDWKWVVLLSDITLYPTWRPNHAQVTLQQSSQLPRFEHAFLRNQTLRFCHWYRISLPCHRVLRVISHSTPRPTTRGDSLLRWRPTEQLHFSKIFASVSEMLDRQRNNHSRLGNPIRAAIAKLRSSVSALRETSLGAGHAGTKAWADWQTRATMSASTADGHLAPPGGKA
jgi:hypothetical protein